MDEGRGRQGTPEVNYTVKELLGDMKRQLEAILGKLDAKADLRDVVDLKDRVSMLERAHEQQTAINRDRAAQEGQSFSRREKLLGLSLAALAVVVQLVGHVHGGAW